MKPLLFLLSVSVTTAEIITSSSTALVTGTQFYPAANVSNGSGLSATPTAENYQSVTHFAANGSSAWTTEAPGGGSADYYNFGPAPIFLFSFNDTHHFSDLVYWGYHFGNPNGNEGKSFRLEFSVDGGSSFGAPVDVTSPAISTSSSTTLSLGGIFSGNAIRLTITDNWFEDFGGGDRVGIGEFRFLGEIPINPAPVIEVNRLLDFGVDPETTALPLLIENRGVVESLVLTPSLESGLRFSAPTAAITIPAGSFSNLSIIFDVVGDGCFSDTLTLVTNDPLNPELRITLLAGVNCPFPAPKKADFSEEEGVFSDPFKLTLTNRDGATILYTLDGSIPGVAGGLVYHGPISVEATVQVRSASYLPGHRPAIRTRSYLKLSSDVASYSSDLPIMVVENFNGGSIPNKGWSTSTQTGGGLQQVARQPAFLGVYARDPVSDSANFSNDPSQTSRIGIRVRGAFSSTWNPKPYSLETWKTDADLDRPVKILGMASDSDWILYYPNASYDRSMLYNTFIWALSGQTGRWAPGFRFVDLFVNENGGDLTMADRKGVYVFLEKPKRSSKRIEYDKLSEDGSSGGWLNSINRMDAIPVGGYPAENGATSPQFFHTAGPNRVQSTPPNVSGSGDDIPRQYNAFINFEDPNGYRITPLQRSSMEDWFREFEDVLYDDDIWRDPEIGYRKYLNTTDFIDYMQMLTLAKQGDGLLLSMFPWVSSGDRKLHMGPMWDFNNGAYGGSTTGTLSFRSDRLWYDRLFDDPDFQREYEDRWFELREGPLANANMASIINSQVAKITIGLADVQPGLSASSWTSRTNSMKSWLQSRANWIDSNFIPPPSFSSSGGIVANGFQLTITNTTGKNGTIYYSRDGSDPIDSLTVYSGPVTPTESLEIKARVLTSGGNWSAIRRAIFVVGAPANRSNLTVSELNYHPSDDSPSTEFIELLNISPTEVIDLTKVSFTTGITFTFPPNTTLAPGERIVVVENESAFVSQHGNMISIAGEFESLTKFANSGEQIILTGADGAAIFEFEFNDKDPWPEFADGDGCTLTLIQPEAKPDLSLGRNWRCSVSPDGSPGTDDSLSFTGSENELAAFVLGKSQPLLIQSETNSVFEFQLMIRADQFIVTPQQSNDLLTWGDLALPSQPLGLIGDGSAKYQVPLDAEIPRKFLRLKITPRP
jgi:hypothetical protein